MSKNSVNVPKSQAELTLDWFSRALNPQFPNIAIDSIELERIGEHYGFASSIYRCHLLGENCPVSLVAKLWDIDGPGGVREVYFYRHLQSISNIKSLYCLVGAVCEKSRRGILILEDLPSAIQGDCVSQLSLSDAVPIAHQVAQLHAAWWGNGDLATHAWLPIVREFKHSDEWFSSRRHLFLESYSTKIPQKISVLINRCEELESRANELLSSTPGTLIHGDLHMDNVIFIGDTSTPCFLDWARVANGPAVLDIADLLFGISVPEEIDRLLEIYYEKLVALGVHQYDKSDLCDDVEGALLLRFIRHTLGIATWNPKSDREHHVKKLGLERIINVVLMWDQRNPDLFD